LNSDWMMPEEIHIWIQENVTQGSTILEFGSGHGSIALAQRYDLISIEHDKEWIGISDSRYIHAEIKENPISTINNQQGWYDILRVLEVLETNTISVFIIDGPPGDIGRHGFLSITDSLSKDAIFIIDDIHRDAEFDIFSKLNEWQGGDAKVFTSRYENGKERKWGVLQPNLEGGSQ
jgi:predicted O-methyltransferase YrrM